MATLTVPPRYRPGFAALIELPDAVMPDLLAGLRAAPPTFSTSVLAAAVAPAVPSLSAAALSDLLDMLLSLYAVLSHEETAAQDLAEDLCQAIEQDGASGLRLPAEQRQSFKAKLTALLEVPKLVIGAKSLDIWFEQNNVFHDARIITDLRPIFGDEPNARPAGSMIVHTLRVTYHHGDSLDDFLIALSDGDLELLSSLIQRARSKATSLTTMLQDAGVPLINLD